MSDETKLVLHTGARHVPRETLASVPTPAATKTWVPVGHETVVATVEQSLGAAGFAVRKSEFALARGDAQLFATFTLESALAAGVSLAVGVRNSMNKSFPMGFAAGSRVFVCDNLAFRAELLVRRKHSVHGLTRFTEAIAGAVTGLKQFQASEAKRITRMQAIEVDDAKAESVMLRAFAARLVSHLVLPRVLQFWREPQHDLFKARTVFSLLNAFTTGMGPRAKTNPQVYAASTMRLYGLLDQNFSIADGDSVVSVAE